MTKLTQTEFTLTGLELIKLIREFIGQRCDAAGLQSHDRWYDTLKLWERNEITEEEFAKRHSELMLRGTLGSISACKEFIQIQKLDLPLNQVGMAETLYGVDVEALADQLLYVDKMVTSDEE
jgi:hypothetical protein|tara:strand:- start:98 stop:463 length:366 start_codon:yes stop_codon:yes gene_type:complete